MTFNSVYTIEHILENCKTVKAKENLLLYSANWKMLCLHCLEDPH